MKKITFLLLLLLTSCGVTQEYYGSYVYTPANNELAKMWYRSHKELVREIDSAAKLQMQDSAWLRKSLSHIPEYGCLFFNVNGTDRGNANPTNWDFLIQDMRGKDLQRTQGHFVIAHSPDNYPYWIANDIDTILVDIPDTFRVFAICRASNQKTDFVVFKDNTHPKLHKMPDGTLY